MITNNLETLGYRLSLNIEQMEDGSYMATSPDLEGFLVLAETIDEVLQLAPNVARTLIETMLEEGIEPKIQREEFRFPVKIEMLVA